MSVFLRTLLVGLLAVFFVFAGLNHFREPESYVGMMPRFLPWAWLYPLTWASGVAEIAGGIGLLVPRLRRAAGWGLIVLLIAVFPANVQVALQGYLPNFRLPEWVLWARLPVQGLFIWTVWLACLAKPARRRLMAEL